MGYTRASALQNVQNDVYSKDLDEPVHPYYLIRVDHLYEEYLAPKLLIRCSLKTDQTAWLPPGAALRLGTHYTLFCEYCFVLFFVL